MVRLLWPLREALAWAPLPCPAALPVSVVSCSRGGGWGVVGRWVRAPLLGDLISRIAPPSRQGLCSEAVLLGPSLVGETKANCHRERVIHHQPGDSVVLLKGALGLGALGAEPRWAGARWGHRGRRLTTSTLDVFSAPLLMGKCSRSSRGLNPWGQRLIVLIGKPRPGRKREFS